MTRKKTITQHTHTNTNLFESYTRPSNAFHKSKIAQRLNAPPIDKPICVFFASFPGRNWLFPPAAFSACEARRPRHVGFATIPAVSGLINLAGTTRGPPLLSTQCKQRLRFEAFALPLCVEFYVLWLLFAIRTMCTLCCNWSLWWIRLIRSVLIVISNLYSNRFI